MPPKNTTQRAYTLRLQVENPQDDMNALWRTHHDINRLVHAYGDWMLTMRGGLSHKWATQQGSTTQKTKLNDIKWRRVILALSWLSVESKRGAPLDYEVPYEELNGTRRYRTLDALEGILKEQGLHDEDISSWIEDCRGSLTAAIRDDAVWINRWKVFQDRSQHYKDARGSCAEHQCEGFTQEDIWDFLGGYFKDIDAYFVIKQQEKTFTDETTKDLSQIARNWLSKRFGGGPGADFNLIAFNYRRLLDWLRSNEVSLINRPSVFVLKKMREEVFKLSPTVDPHEGLVGDLLKQFSGRGYKSRSRNLIARLASVTNLTKDDYLSLCQSLEDDFKKCSNNIGKKGSCPYAEYIFNDVMTVTGIHFPYILKESKKKEHTDQYSVILDHAARRLMQTHTWIKKAEHRRQEDEQQLKNANIPEPALRWLRDYCRRRGQETGALDEYRIRQRAITGWDKIVEAWWAEGVDASDQRRIDIVRELQNDPEFGEKIGDINLFEAIAKETSKCIWIQKGRPDPSVLKEFVRQQEASARLKNYKVPAYRHPDPCFHPVFCDYGQSRWHVGFDCLALYGGLNRKRHSEDAKSLLPHGLTLEVFDETQPRRIRSLRLKWRSKRFSHDLGIPHNQDKPGPVIPRADRFGRIAAGACDAETVRLSCFTEKQWNGRLQADRFSLKQIGRLMEDPSCDPRTIQEKTRRLKWFLTVSLNLAPAKGRWSAFKDAFIEQNLMNKQRKYSARPLLARLPAGLRVVSVDLGHRNAAACCVWQTISREKIESICNAAGRNIPTSDDLYLEVELDGRKKIFRRIGPDQIQQKPHLSPWSMLDRQFMIKLQGEERPPRAPTQDEKKWIVSLRQRLGYQVNFENEASSVIDWMMEACVMVRRFLQRHKIVARIVLRLKSNQSGQKSHYIDYFKDLEALRLSPYWKDPFITKMWQEHVVNLLRDEEEFQDNTSRGLKDHMVHRLIASWEAGVNPPSLQGWLAHWQEQDELIKETIRQLRRWILPRAGWARAHRYLTRCRGGVSLNRLAVIDVFYRLEKAFYTRLRPDGMGPKIHEGFAARIEKTLKNLKEQRVKQSASRIIEAALGCGRIPSQDLHAARHPITPMDEPCHAIVVEYLSRYRPDQIRTRRENKRIMTWSAARIRKFLEEMCTLYGLGFFEVNPNYTSRQDSRTGAPGLRCVDVPVKNLYKTEYWRKRIQSAQDKIKKNTATEVDRYLVEVHTHFTEQQTATTSVRIPMEGGPIFVSAQSDSPASKGINADLNAAANIGLQALMDPDWPGRWWWLPCLPTGRVALDKVQGTTIIDPSYVYLQPNKELQTRTRRNKIYINAWRDVSADALTQGIWKSYKEYWQDVEKRVVDILRNQLFVATPQT